MYFNDKTQLIGDSNDKNKVLYLTKENNYKPVQICLDNPESHLSKKCLLFTKYKNYLLKRSIDNT